MKRPLSLLVSALTGLLALVGCTPTQFVNSFVSPDLSGATVSYGPHPRNAVDIYTQDEGSRGLLVFVHGGYWDEGDKSEYVFVANTFTERGYTVALVNYRLVPEVTFPAYVQDLARALTWLRTQGPYSDLPLFLMGHSAGAHIGALVAFDESYLAEFGLSPELIDGFIGLAGPYNFLPLGPNDDRSRAALGDPATYPQTQPINFVDADDPRTFLAVSLNDETVNPNNSLSFAAAIEDAGGEVELKEYNDLNHATIVGALSGVGRVLNQNLLADVLAFMEGDVGGP